MTLKNRGIGHVSRTGARRMDAEFGWRQGKDEPASTSVNGVISEHVAEEGAIGFGVLAVAQVPILNALGTTVAAGAAIAFELCAILIPPYDRAAT